MTAAAAMFRRKSRKLKKNMDGVRSEECLLTINEHSLLKTALRRSNSMNNASRSSTLKSNRDLNLEGLDSDFEVEDEHTPWSARFHKASKESANSLPPQDLKRQDIIEEFIHTEKTYLRNLILLHKAYQEPLVESSMISLGVSNRIFFNLTTLTELHREFKKDLVSLQTGSTEYVENIAPSILTFFSNLSFEEEIIKYCINLTDSLLVLKESMRTSDFAAFLIDLESNPICRRKHLKELLPNPIQRVTKYPLLVQQIMKSTDPESEEYAQLSECLECVKQICNKINNEVARVESLRIEKSARARLLADDMNRITGDVILNLPAFCDDDKVNVNIVMFEYYIVLFPNTSLLYSSQNEGHIEDSIRIIAIEEPDVFICPDKQEKRSFYLISKSLPLICPIICRSVEERDFIIHEFERVKNKKGSVPVMQMKLLELEDAEENERNRPPSTAEDDRNCHAALDQRRGHNFESQSSTDRTCGQILDTLNVVGSIFYTHRTKDLSNNV